MKERKEGRRADNQPFSEQSYYEVKFPECLIAVRLFLEWNKHSFSAFELWFLWGWLWWKSLKKNLPSQKNTAQQNKNTPVVSATSLTLPSTTGCSLVSLCSPPLEWRLYFHKCCSWLCLTQRAWHHCMKDEFAGLLWVLSVCQKSSFTFNFCLFLRGINCDCWVEVGRRLRGSGSMYI